MPWYQVRMRVVRLVIACDGVALQEAAVKQYLASAGIPFPPAGSFNASGRAYPDVSGISAVFCRRMAGNF